MVQFRTSDSNRGVNTEAEIEVSWYRVAARYLLYFISLVGFWSGALVCNLLALCFLPWHGEASVRSAARIWLHRLLVFARRSMGTIHAIRFDLKGTEILSELRSTVVVANHQSLLDAVYLLSLVPDALCIFKKSIQRNIALGPMAWLCGFIANDAGPDLVREAVAALSEGCNVIVFPEGTRSQGRLNPFKSGFALIACRARCPIQTVHLSTDPALLPKGASLMDLPHRQPLVCIHPGRRFSPTPGLRTTDLVREVEAYFQD